MQNDYNVQNNSTRKKYMDDLNKSDVFWKRIFFSTLSEEK